MIFISKVNQKLVSSSADNVINSSTVFFEVIAVLRYREYVKSRNTQSDESFECRLKHNNSNFIRWREMK